MKRLLLALGAMLVCAMLVCTPQVVAMPFLNTFSGDLGAVLLHCTPNLSEQANVDPIADYGISPTAHEHTPAGAMAFSSTSTLSQMTSASTSCVIHGDHSMIWIPTPMQANGQPATISDFAYYLRTNGPVVSDSTPNDLQLIGGDAHCTGTSCPPTYQCAGPNGEVVQHTIPTPSQCNPGQGYDMQINGPGQCWDGQHLGPGMGINNGPLSITQNSSCPNVNVPLIEVSIAVASNGLGGYLSSDVPQGTQTTSPGSTGHFDYVFGWVNDTLDGDSALQDLIDTCLNTSAFGGKTSCVESGNIVYQEKADHSGPDLTKPVTN